MPRPSEIQVEEAVPPKSPLRRSCRIVAVSSTLPEPKQVKGRRSSATSIDNKYGEESGEQSSAVRVTRASSITKDITDPKHEPVKTRGRRSSVTSEQPDLKTAKPVKGRRSSVTIEEEKKPVRGRRSSIQEDELLPRNTRSTRSASKEKEEEESVKEIPEKKKTRSKESSEEIKIQKPVKTPNKPKRRLSITENAVILESINESPNEVKEKDQPIEIDLSVIKESSFTEEMEESSKISPIVLLNKLEKTEERAVTPTRKSPRIMLKKCHLHRKCDCENSPIEEIKRKKIAFNKETEINLKEALLKVEKLDDAVFLSHQENLNDSKLSDKENITENIVKKNHNNRASNVFRPKDIDYSFMEAMDVDTTIDNSKFNKTKLQIEESIDETISLNLEISINESIKNSEESQSNNNKLNEEQEEKEPVKELKSKTIESLSEDDDDVFEEKYVKDMSDSYEFQVLSDDEEIEVEKIEENKSEELKDHIEKEPIKDTQPTFENLNTSINKSTKDEEIEVEKIEKNNSELVENTQPIFEKTAPELNIVLENLNKSTKSELKNSAEDEEIEIEKIEENNSKGLKDHIEKEPMVDTQPIFEKTAPELNIIENLNKSTKSKLNDSTKGEEIEVEKIEESNSKELKNHIEKEPMEDTQPIFKNATPELNIVENLNKSTKWELNNSTEDKEIEENSSKELKDYIEKKPIEDMQPIFEKTTPELNIENLNTSKNKSTKSKLNSTIIKELQDLSEDEEIEVEKIEANNSKELKDHIEKKSIEDTQKTTPELNIIENLNKSTKSKLNDSTKGEEIEVEKIEESNSKELKNHIEKEPMEDTQPIFKNATPELNIIENLNKSTKWELNNSTEDKEIEENSSKELKDYIEKKPIEDMQPIFEKTTSELNIENLNTSKNKSTKSKLNSTIIKELQVLSEDEEIEVEKNNSKQLKDHVEKKPIKDMQPIKNTKPELIILRKLNKSNKSELNSTDNKEFQVLSEDEETEVEKVEENNSKQLKDHTEKKPIEDTQPIKNAKPELNIVSKKINKSTKSELNNKEFQVLSEDEETDVEKEPIKDAQPIFKNTAPELNINKSTKSELNNKSPKFSLDELTNSKLDEFIERKLNDFEEDTEEEEEDNNFVDDIAEEGEEDTPSEDSNDIIEVGESIHSDSDRSEDDYDENDDSFVSDDEENYELLSGDEYDLGDGNRKKSRIINVENRSESIIKIEKKSKIKPKNKTSRIIKIDDSSSDDDDEKNNRVRKSSINIIENIDVKEINDTALSDRVNQLIDTFCTTIPQEGGISMNISLEYEETDKSNKNKRKSTSNEYSNPSKEPKLSDNKNQNLKKLKKKKVKKQKKDNTPPSTNLSSEDLKEQTYGLMVQLFNDVKNRPKRVVNPSTTNLGIKNNWQVGDEVGMKPSTSSVSQKEIDDFKQKKLHPKDFRNQILNDPTRVKRMETKRLLKKRLTPY